jgi:hypothetical protein
MVARYEGDGGALPRVQRVEVASGRAQPWNGIGHTPLRAGGGAARLLVSPDGESYAYNYVREQADLWLTSALR